MGARVYKYFLMIILLFSAAGLKAQDEFSLNGVVMVSGASTRIALAEITNQRTGYTVGSNDMGLFRIKALNGDTLVVVKRDFRDRKVVVVSSKDMVITLNRESTTLSEVNIRGKSKKMELDEIKQEFRDKGSFYQGKPPVLSYFFKPLTALYELFGKTPKNARRFGKYYATEMQQTQVDGFFNESLIRNNTDLEGAELEKFMLNYRPDYEKSKHWTSYDAVKYIRDSYQQYTDTLKKK